jgi:hypothetical protein
MRRPINCVAPSLHPPLDLQNQLMMATGVDTQWASVRQSRAIEGNKGGGGRGGEGGDE